MMEQSTIRENSIIVLFLIRELRGCPLSLTYVDDEAFEGSKVRK